MKFTQDQIDTYKKQHGDIFMCEAGELSCILKKPTRQQVGMAMTLSKQDPLKLTEVIIVNCWVAGDEEIKTDVGALMGITGQIDQILEVKNAEIKKL